MRTLGQVSFAVSLALAWAVVFASAMLDVRVIDMLKWIVS